MAWGNTYEANILLFPAKSIYSTHEPASFFDYGPSINQASANIRPFSAFPSATAPDPKQVCIDSIPHQEPPTSTTLFTLDHSCGARVEPSRSNLFRLSSLAEVDQGRRAPPPHSFAASDLRRRYKKSRKNHRTAMWQRRRGERVLFVRGQLLHLGRTALGPVYPSKVFKARKKSMTRHRRLRGLE